MVRQGGGVGEMPRDSFNCGGCFHYGLGTHQDYTMAAKYYRLSAEQTNYVAMKSLGFLLMNGYGMATNEDEAKAPLLRAAT